MKNEIFYASPVFSAFLTFEDNDMKDATRTEDIYNLTETFKFFVLVDICKCKSIA